MASLVIKIEIKKVKREENTVYYSFSNCLILLLLVESHAVITTTSSKKHLVMAVTEAFKPWDSNFSKVFSTLDREDCTSCTLPPGLR